jgi:hypothetical protein
MWRLFKNLCASGAFARMYTYTVQHHKFKVEGVGLVEWLKQV